MKLTLSSDRLAPFLLPALLLASACSSSSAPADDEADAPGEGAGAQDEADAGNDGGPAPPESFLFFLGSLNAVDPVDAAQVFEVTPELDTSTHLLQEFLPQANAGDPSAGISVRPHVDKVYHAHEGEVFETQAVVVRQPDGSALPPETRRVFSSPGSSIFSIDAYAHGDSDVLMVQTDIENLILTLESDGDIVEESLSAQPIVAIEGPQFNGWLVQDADALAWVQPDGERIDLGDIELDFTLTFQTDGGVTFMGRGGDNLEAFDPSTGEVVEFGFALGEFFSFFDADVGGENLFGFNIEEQANVGFMHFFRADVESESVESLLTVPDVDPDASHIMRVMGDHLVFTRTDAASGDRFLDSVGTDGAGHVTLDSDGEFPFFLQGTIFHEEPPVLFYDNGDASGAPRVTGVALDGSASVELDGYLLAGSRHADDGTVDQVLLLDKVENRLRSFELGAFALEDLGQFLVDGEPVPAEIETLSIDPSFSDASTLAVGTVFGGATSRLFVFGADGQLSEVVDLDAEPQVVFPVLAD